MNIFLLFCSIVCVCVFPLLVYIPIYVITLELLCGIHTVVTKLNVRMIAASKLAADIVVYQRGLGPQSFVVFSSDTIRFVAHGI